jgi:hypothetical protein
LEDGALAQPYVVGFAAGATAGFAATGFAAAGFAATGFDADEDFPAAARAALASGEL